MSFKCEPHFTISFKLRKCIIWKFFVRKIFSFLVCPLSIYSIIYLYQCGFIDINLLDCNLIRSVFCCSKHFSLCYLELLVGSCVLFTCPNKFFLFCFFFATISFSGTTRCFRLMFCVFPALDLELAIFLEGGP